MIRYILSIFFIFRAGLFTFKVNLSGASGGLQQTKTKMRESQSTRAVWIYIK